MIGCNEWYHQTLNFMQFSSTSILLSTDAAEVPLVCVMLEGGPNTLKTVLSAVKKRTPAVIVKVSQVLFL